MHLKELIADIYSGDWDNRFDHLIVSGICDDSRNVQKGDVFVAVKGAVADGYEFVEQAIASGASAVIVEKMKSEWGQFSDVCFLTVNDTKKFLRDIVGVYYERPSQHINMIGITGTNGKTTISYLIESILHEDDRSCSVIGTVNYRIAERILPANNTTPGIIQMQALLTHISEDGIENCVMEVSSHALDQGRIDLIDFNVAVFSNLTSDHLDYHKTRENYFAAKSKLFINLSPEAKAVINVDDDYGRKLFSKTQAGILTYGIYKNADVYAKDIELGIQQSRFKIIFPDTEIMINSPLVGEYNIYNMLASAAACYAQGVPVDRIKKGIEHLKNVPGRLEPINLGQDFSIFIDYAHTEDALHNVLSAIKNTCDNKIICVFGCGGDRDPSKRSKMGQVASELADFTIVTSDNPRTEDPQSIINQILEGMDTDNYKVIVNREEAICEAIKMASADDIVLIAGKGHEDYQIFDNKKIHFDEKAIIRKNILC